MTESEVNLRTLARDRWSSQASVFVQDADNENMEKIHSTNELLSSMHKQTNVRYPNK